MMHIDIAVENLDEAVAGPLMRGPRWPGTSHRNMFA